MKIVFLKTTWFIKHFFAAHLLNKSYYSHLIIIFLLQRLK